MISFKKDMLLIACLSCLMAEVAFCQLTESEKEEILNEHNRLRGIVTPTASNMKRLIWNDELAQVAQSYAEQCVFAHNSERSSQSPSFQSVGENLAVRTGPADYIQDINNWYNEVADYTYDTNSCNEGAVCGHYTQVVWATSRHVGCGAVRCAQLQGFATNAVNLVCNYGPAGNFNNLRPYMPGPSCSACPADLPSCVDNLCSISEAPLSATTPTTMTSSTSSSQATTPTTVASPTSSSQATTPTTIPSPSTRPTFSAFLQYFLRLLRIRSQFSRLEFRFQSRQSG